MKKKQFKTFKDIEKELKNKRIDYGSCVYISCGDPDSIKEEITNLKILSYTIYEFLNEYILPKLGSVIPDKKFTEVKNIVGKRFNLIIFDQVQDINSIKKKLLKLLTKSVKDVYFLKKENK